MAEIAHLNNAPIYEALIDLKTKLKSDFDVKQFLSIHEKIKNQYPEKTEAIEFESKLELKKDLKPLSTSSETLKGYWFRTIDKKQIVQTRIDGFTFNRLNPYECWENLRDEAYRIWKIYRDLVNPEIIRVAVRYINKISIPLYPQPLLDFNEYLTAAPIIPKELPQGVNSFFNKVVIEEPDTGITAIITQVFEQIVDPRYCPIMLDIDVFKHKEFFENNEAWELFERLRNFKNRIFFSLITEKLKELFI